MYYGNAVADICYFNPRPREEGDSIRRKNEHIGGNFNPRPREEGDGTALLSVRKDIYFNPRPREEGDSSEDKSTIIIDEFQSTPS